jgi:hypothetical protein
LNRRDNKILEVSRLDKKPEADPLIVLLERSESVNNGDHALYIRCTLISSYHESAVSTFTGFYSSSQNRASLSNSSLLEGAIFLEPSVLRGNRVGTYILNQIVLWLSQWPNAVVNSIYLSNMQSTFDNKERRNRFYEQFGLVFEYESEEKEAGKSHKMPVSQLTPVDSWESNIKECKLNEFISDLQTSHELLQYENENIRRANKRLAAENIELSNRPLKQFFLSLGYDLKYSALPIIFVLTVAFAFYKTLY